MYCTKCGAQIDNQAIVCPNCGVGTHNYNSQVRSAQGYAQPIVINNNNTNTNMNTGGYAGAGVQKSKWTAFLLCFFLGWLGAHRFYVGKNGTGIIWLLTVGLSGVGVFFDLIFILIGSFRDKSGMPLI